MGIRFYCPNGHKLNVKSHLAGKTGFCPECGVRLVIPLQSTRQSSREIAAEQEHGDAAMRSDNVPALSLDDDGNAPSQFGTAAAPPQTAPAFSGTPAENPLLQDQTVVWYLQVPGGQQFGPANGQTVQGWMLEHRITPQMLVWREGWANWLEAKDVFPEIGK
jgi:hypothetical protein